MGFHTVDDTGHQVFLALGSNLSDRLQNLRAAIQRLPPQVLPLECSPVYETEPWGYRDQPAFLNQVIRASTHLDPLGLLAHLKGLEQQLGRRQTVKYGPRSIDLDLLFYDNLVLSSPSLTIPHPRLGERAFVLVPLADLAPDLRHPASGESVQQMLATTGTAGVQWFAPGGCWSDAGDNC